MQDQLIDSWAINNRINLYLLEAVPDAALHSAPTGLKGREVSGLFAHIHNARLLWLEVSAPKLLETVSKIPLKTKVDRERVDRALLQQSLGQSGEAMAALFRDGIEKGKIKEGKPHVIGFFSYFIAHESYHRAEICMTLTEAGYPLPDEVLYGQWEWGKR